MQTLRRCLICFLCAIMSLALFGKPSFSEMNASEQILPREGVVEELYQAGNGLPVGKILSVRENAVIFHRDPAVGYRAKTGLPLYEGDTISTRNKARILCRLIDGSQFILSPETTLSILKSSYNFTRKTGILSLFLKQGDARFQVRRPTEFSALDFKVKTEAILTAANDAGFVIRMSEDKTDITAFVDSRLEVTRTANPEDAVFLSDLQRLVVTNGSEFSILETVSQEEADALRAEFSILPSSKLFASSAEKYQAEDSGQEGEAGEGFIEGDSIEPVFDTP
jgi:hypothetical protein